MESFCAVDHYMHFDINSIAILFLSHGKTGKVSFNLMTRELVLIQLVIQISREPDANRILHFKIDQIES